MRDWKRIREVFAFLGFIASMVFVGLEIRQNTAATRGQTRQELAALNQEFLILVATDQTFSELLYRAWEQEGPVTPEEEYRVEMIQTLNLRRLENVFFQYQQGLVDETALRSYGLQRVDMNRPRMREWWIDKGWRSAFHPDFVAFLEGEWLSTE